MKIQPTMATTSVMPEMATNRHALAGYMSVQLMLLTYDFGNARVGYKPTYDSVHKGYMSIQPTQAIYIPT